MRRLLSRIGLLLPFFALGLRAAAFRFPSETERIYGEAVYPHIAALMGSVSTAAPFSIAETGLALSLAALLAYIFFWARPWRTSNRRPFLLRWVGRVWVGAGALGIAFLVLWGLNYARPGLETRLHLEVERVEMVEVMAAARRCARWATELHDELDQSENEPTRLSIGFSTLNEIVDRRLDGLALPGYARLSRTGVAKRLWSSPMLSYLGISGIFIAFTGEPSINAMVPDPALPMVVAHEKAHQRGVTNEGEATLAAFLACSKEENVFYVPYSAYLHAASELLAAASRRWPDDAATAWAALGQGPRRDLEAIREFWDSYRGPVAETADKVNDAYLRSFRVAGGTQNYRRVVRLIIALDRRGRLRAPRM